MTRAPAGYAAPDLAGVLLTQEEIAAKVRELAGRIQADYAGRELYLVGILKGAVVFVADLLRHLDMPVRLDFMAVSSYGAASQSSGAVRILKDLDETIEGRHVLVVEDIMDTGLTLHYLVESLLARRPASLRLCALLDKPARRRIPVQADYLGFSIPDEFIVGYGLDFAGRYRNLPYIGIMKKEALGKG